MYRLWCTHSIGDATAHVPDFSSGYDPASYAVVQTKRRKAHCAFALTAGAASVHSFKDAPLPHRPAHRVQGLRMAESTGTHPHSRCAPAMPIRPLLQERRPVHRWAGSPSFDYVATPGSPPAAARATRPPVTCLVSLIDLLEKVSK